MEYSGIQPLREQNWLIYCSLPKILDSNLLVYTFISTSATTEVRERKPMSKIFLISCVKR